MSSKEKLIDICIQALKDKGLDTHVYRDRLKKEIKEINNQDEYDYFIDLYESFNKNNTILEINENNLLVAYLLNICKSFDINQNYKSNSSSDFPDIDTDFVGEARDYLKNNWAPKKFGQDKVCNICNYTTYRLKSAFIDVARVYNKDRYEILEITKSLENKDDDGDDLTYETAVEIYPKLAEYCKNNPEVADAASRLVGRVRGLGQHAGGLIISKSNIDDLVPLVTDKHGNILSSWSEGQHTTDLSPVGLVKFDLLVVKDLERIIECCRLIRKANPEMVDICAKSEGDYYFSDDSFIEDKKMLDVADKAKTKSIFQFNSPGMREMIRKGGVTTFEDLSVYSSLYRPGPMLMDMHNSFIERKKGIENYEIYPALKEILGPTHGVMVYQEQIMKILNRIGNIPLIHCEKIRKAISKKKEKEFKKYKIQFIENGQKILGCSLEEIESFWKQIASFAEYGFNRSHSVGYAYNSCAQLWQKAYHLLPFFASALKTAGDSNGGEDKDIKIKGIKFDANRNGIEVLKVELNKSGISFDIRDNKIYAGFSNIKGIGDAVAKRIVEGQPYSSFEDFLFRFGTEAKVIKPFLSLGVFKESSPEILYEFYEAYKNEKKNIEGKIGRIEKNIEKHELLLKSYVDLTKEQIETIIKQPDMGDLKQYCLEELREDAASILEKISKYTALLEETKSMSPNVTFSNFVPTGKIPEDIKASYLKPIQEAEVEYYGFGWGHYLEKSPDYDGERTFSSFEDESKLSLCIECQVIKPIEKKVSKSGNSYYTLLVEDADWQQNYVNIWDNDYERFKEELDYWDGESGRGNML